MHRTLIKKNQITDCHLQPPAPPTTPTKIEPQPGSENALQYGNFVSQNGTAAHSSVFWIAPVNVGVELKFNPQIRRVHEITAFVLN